MIDVSPRSQLNGSTSVPTASHKGKRKPRKRSTVENPAIRIGRQWALFGVIFTTLLSSLLNGYANAQHAQYAMAGWLMGIAVPVLVLTLCKVAGESLAVGMRGVAMGSGASGIALLFLSVWHCSSSIAFITGSTTALAIPMAVAIDCGLVACECHLIASKRK